MAAPAAPPNVPVHLIRPTLTDLPRHALPAGYRLRWFAPGDEATWTAVERATETFYPIGAELHPREFGSDPAALPARQVFLETDDGRAIGTASAWYAEPWEGGLWGRIHWVAILPTYQGRGLAKPLLAAVCERLHWLGHERAMLATSTGRLPAIRLYLQFGFRPHRQTDADRAAWAAIKDKLRDVWREEEERE